jgi:lambda repressor-like predicted transcriptional regulator
MGRYEPALLLAWSMSAAGLAFADVDHPIRTVFALVFLAFVPGLAITRALHLNGLATRLLLALPISLSLAALISAALVYVGFPSWNLGLSMLLSVTVGAIASDLARVSIPTHRPGRITRNKLDDETRQAALVHSLLEGATLAEAAQAAGVSTTTLQRALQRSERLRMAAMVATHGELDATPHTSGGGASGAGRARQHPRR